MNTELVKQEIEHQIESLHNEFPKASRNQYPATKGQLKQLEELGILDLMPKAPYAKHVGSMDAKRIIELATAKATARMNAYGEGDAIGSSHLYELLNAPEARQECQAGAGENGMYGIEVYSKKGYGELTEQEWSEIKTAIGDWMLENEDGNSNTVYVEPMDADKTIRALNAIGFTTDEDYMLDPDAASYGDWSDEYDDDPQPAETLHFTDDPEEGEYRWSSECGYIEVRYAPVDQPTFEAAMPWLVEVVGLPNHDTRRQNAYTSFMEAYLEAVKLATINKCELEIN